MATIKLGIISEARGSEGGVVFSRNKGGAYTRARVTPVNPFSARRETVKAELTAAAQAWQGLTDSQRQGWTNYGATVGEINRVGDVIEISGINAYIRSRLAAINAGLAVPTAVPSPAIAGNSAELGGIITLDAALQEVILTTTSFVVPLEAGERFYVQQGRPVSSGVNYYRSPFVLLGNGDVPTTGFSLTLPVSVGAKVFFRVRRVTQDGRVGLPFITSAIASAV